VAVAAPIVRRKAIAVDRRSARFEARSIRRATTSSSILREALTSAPIRMIANEPTSIPIPVPRETRSIRIAKIELSAVAAARIVAVVAPSSAHWLRNPEPRSADQALDRPTYQ